LELPLGALLRHHANRKERSAPAVVHPPESVTWGDLEARANRQARFLRAHGVQPGDFVSIALPNGAQLFESTFAVWKLGATPATLSPRLAAPEARAILELVRPRVFIAESNDWGCAAVSPQAAAGEGWSTEAFEEAPPAKYWKAMTSGGSTGRPKVIVDHKPAVQDPHAPIRGQPVDGVVLNPGPLSHNAPFLYAHMALFCGSRLVSLGRFDALEVLAAIECHRVQWASFVPTMMHRIWSLPAADREKYDLSSLQTIWHMAAPMPPWLKSAWLGWLGPDRLWEGYGGTEGLGFTALSGREALSRPGSVGRLVSQGAMKVLDQHGDECAPNEIGEIFFLPSGGPGSTYHYLGAEPRRTPDGWETFGDLGHLDAQGYLYLADRRTDLIVRGGANVYPAEIESLAAGYEGVAACVVIGLPDPDLGRSVHVIVEPQSGAAIEVVALDTYLSTQLAAYKRPATYEIVNTPLRDEAGKARRLALREEREAWLRKGVAFRMSRHGVVGTPEGESDAANIRL
jgi:bile acid-coenzyme A ligase